MDVAEPDFVFLQLEDTRHTSATTTRELGGRWGGGGCGEEYYKSWKIHNMSKGHITRS